MIRWGKSIQLWHVGRMSHPDFHNGALPLSASAINQTINHLPRRFKEYCYT
jgi:N-ethylmaleimide reductase